MCYVLKKVFGDFGYIKKGFLKSFFNIPKIYLKIYNDKMNLVTKLDRLE
jgi:hypothetical protein